VLGVCILVLQVDDALHSSAASGRAYQAYRRQPERVRLPVDRAGGGNLPQVVDASGVGQRHAAAGWDQAIQVAHVGHRTVVVQERVLVAAARAGVADADDLAAGVDAISGAARVAGEGAQVGGSVNPARRRGAERVRVAAAARAEVADADDLAAGVDAGGVAVGAAGEDAQVGGGVDPARRHGAERVRVVAALAEVADELAAGVDALSRAVGAAREGAQVGGGVDPACRRGAERVPGDIMRVGDTDDLTAGVDAGGAAFDTAGESAQVGGGVDPARRRSAERVLVAAGHLGVADDLAAGVDAIGVAVGAAGEGAQVGHSVRRRRIGMDGMDGRRRANREASRDGKHEGQYTKAGGADTPQPQGRWTEDCPPHRVDLSAPTGATNYWCQATKTWRATTHA